MMAEDDIYDSGARRIELVLRCHEGRARLVIPGMLLSRAQSFCVQDIYLNTLFKSLFTNSEGSTRRPRPIKRTELEELELGLARYAFDVSALREEGTVEWLPGQLSGALLEASIEQTRRVTPAAVLGLALRRGLMIEHMRDEWYISTAR